MNATQPDGRPLSSTLGVLIPRRSAKTTSIIAVALGRCDAREDYRVAFTLATTRDKAAARFRKDIVPPLERMYPDKDSRPFIIRKSNGSESITWPNGSTFEVVTPGSEGFRSEAYDLIIVDESGEATPELGEDIKAGALATMDTRPDAQIVFAGTAAKYRTANLLWDVLEDGRAGVPGTGILEYSSPLEPTVDDLEDWEITRELALAAHPGIGTLTTLATVQERHRLLKPEQFAAEYLSIFGNVGGGLSLFDQEKWMAGALPSALPNLAALKRFSLAIAVHPDQTSAAIVAAWRSRGKARVMVLDYRAGVAWLADRAAFIAAKYRLPIVHDTRGPVMVEVEVLQQRKDRPRLKPQTTRNVTTAAQLVAKEISLTNVEHWNQPEMNLAVQQVRKRQILGSWGMGRGVETDDITPIEAAALALRVYDETPERRAFTPKAA